MKSIIPFHVVLLLMTITSLPACQNDADKGTGDGDPPRQVETALVRAVDFRETVFATGRLSSKEEVRLSFKTGGIIKAIHVHEGQTVREGQLLAELDLDEVRAQTEQARLGQKQASINIQNAGLAVQLAERDYQNALGLYRDSVATLEQLQNAEIALDNARNQLEAAKTGLDVTDQQVNVATFNLKYSKITAPSTGVILKKLSEPNELVAPGSPVFLFGSRDKAQVIKVNITDKDIIHVRLENEAEVRFDAYPETTFQGIVREVASMADPYTGTYEVEVEVLPAGKQLLNGFIGSVRIQTDDRKALLEAPVDALVTADERSGKVFVVRDSTAEETVVIINRIYDGKLLLERGLKAGDAVVVSGAGYLENGQRVIGTVDTSLSLHK